MDMLLRSSKLKTAKWSFSNNDADEWSVCKDYSTEMKDLLKKDVIPSDKLQALISDNERINPALIMQIRSNSVRKTSSRNETPSVPENEIRIRRDKVKRYEKRRQMALVNREIINLNKESKVKLKTRDRENKNQEQQLQKLDKMKPLKPLHIPEYNSPLQGEPPPKIELSEVDKLYDIEKDIHLIMDCLKSNNELLMKDSKIANDCGTISTTIIKANKLEKKYFEIWVKVMQKRRDMKTNGSRKREVSRFFQLLKQQKNIIKKHEKTSSCYDEVYKEGQVAEDAGGETNKTNGNFRHRYMLQKNVIALQKCKLEEQNRIIEELKLNKIIEATKDSMDHLKDEVKESYQKFARSNKPRVKCLANEIEIHPDENEEHKMDPLELHCLKVPKFLQKMEQRAKEREEKHAIIRERRKQMDEERVRLKQQAELLKAEMDEDEKRRRIEDLREKRRSEKLEKVRRRREEERTRTLAVMADLHYEKKILHRVIASWLNEVKLTKQKMLLAKEHRNVILKRLFLRHWKSYTDSVWRKQYEKAFYFYRCKLLDKALSAWKMYCYEILLNKQVAEDWYDFHVLERMFQYWNRYSTNMTKIRLKQWDDAGKQYESQLLWNAWCSWRTLPAINRLKREQDLRKMKWRQRVLQVVPDYKPPED